MTEKSHNNDDTDKVNRGEIALRATGMVPAGAVFLTNMSKDPIDVDPQEVKKSFERKGYEVIVIPDQAFDVNGKHFEDSDAWVGIKKQQ